MSLTLGLAVLGLGPSPKAASSQKANVDSAACNSKSQMKNERGSEPRDPIVLQIKAAV